MATTEAARQARRAYPHDLIPGAIIRVQGDSLHDRPYGLEITRRGLARDGRIGLTGKLLAQDGTTKRAKRAMRFAVVDPALVTVIRKAPPAEYTAKIATLACPSPDPELGLLLTTRWCVVDADGKPLPGEGTGPARIGDYVQTGDWEGKPTPWLAREYSDLSEGERLDPVMRRDPITQCTDRVRQERGILRVERLTHDLSAWHHGSAQELREVSPGVKAWRDTYVCKRCQQPLKWIDRSPWFAAAADGDTECHGEVWVP